MILVVFAKRDAKREWVCSEVLEEGISCGDFVMRWTYVRFWYATLCFELGHVISSLVVYEGASTFISQVLFILLLSLRSFKFSFLPIHCLLLYFSVTVVLFCYQ